MAHLHLENIGPVRFVDLYLKRFNVFIGPQSSGKSTIAKILSFCSWIEKRVATTLSENIFTKNKDFVDTVETYHKMKGYFHDDSVVMYHSDVVSIEYVEEKLSVKLLNKEIYHRKKIVYMPSDRNLVAMPELEKLILANHTNMQSFTFDWLNARTTFDKEHKLDLLNLGMQYYFDSQEQTYKDKIVHTNGESYDIALYNASSGLQSITPIVLMFNYYTGLYFKEYERFTSFEKQLEQQRLLARIANLYPDMVDAKKNEDENSLYAAKIAETVIEATKIRNLANREKLYKQLTTPDAVNVIIEEPEQNLFPEAQESLLYWMIQKIKNKDRDNSIVITTHSPYILFALNNCLIGGLVGNKLPNQQELQSHDAWVNPKDVAVFEIHDGTLKSVQDEDYLLDNNYLNRAYQKISKEYLTMLDYYVE